MKNKNGFTLIELLVVVLIIGILAAIAFPKYQTAVLKTKITSVIPITKSIKDSAERYYLINGIYPEKWSDLDISFKGFSGDMENKHEIISGNIMIDLYASGADIAAYCASDYGTADIIAYALWFDRNTPPVNISRRQCWALSERAEKVCKSLGGVKSTFAPRGGWTTYNLQ